MPILGIYASSNYTAPAVKTYEAIATVTVGSGGSSSIDFSSIPSTYTDLCVQLSSRTNNGFAGSFWEMKFNNTTANRKLLRIYSSNNTTGSDTDTNLYGYTNGDTATANTFASTFIYIPNYTSSNYKSCSWETTQENNTSVANSDISGGLWSDTTAINRITFTVLS